jgi:hypothetical protein
VIQAGELALASVGISTILADALPKMGKGRIEEMQQIPRKIRSLARALVDGELQYTPMDRPHSYKQLLAVIGGLPRSVNVQSWIDKFDVADHEISGPFAISIQDALRDIAQIFPRQSYVTLVGPIPLPPSELEMFTFYSALDVINDPLRVFPLMASGGLSKRQTDTVRMVFPGISAAIDEALRGAEGEIIKAKGRKVSFQLPPKAGQFGIPTWFGHRIVQYEPPQPQPPDGQKQDENKAPRARMRSGKQDSALDKATQTQKIDAGV